MKQGLVCKLCTTFIALLLIYVLSLTLVFMLPNERIVANAHGKIELLYNADRGGLQRYLTPTAKQYEMPVDAFTDIVMLTRNDNCNQHLDSLTQSMQKFFYLPEHFPEEYYSSPVKAAMNMNGYQRYWHGYQVFLRPLLYIFDYEQIRYFNMGIFALGVLSVGWLLYKQLGLLTVGGFLLALAICKAPLIPFCMQFMNMFCLMLGSMLFLGLYTLPQNVEAIKQSSFKSLYIFVFIIGSLTAFFDFLTTPLLPIGMIMLYLLVYFYRNYTFGFSWKFFSTAYILWGVGYAATWISKWCLTLLVLQQNIFAQVYRQAVGRILPIKIVEEGQQITANGAAALMYNIKMLATPLDVLIFTKLLLICILILLLLKYFYPRMNFSHKLGMQLLVIAALPLIWYMCMVNHSFIHCWFTYRSMFVSVMSLVIYSSYAIDWQRFFTNRRNN